ncbi:MAG: FixH family protein [Gammaproteobacteria bacterium]|nr:FixH family protein [Gammaproteobacteria bacterium]MBQ0838152.1 FixH family protein [Gammaproteobacteria bacterium]
MVDHSGAGQITPPAPPWYRQFWPWFLIALPASVVVAGFFTLYLAIKYSDDLVSDNYYRDGLAINLQLNQDVRATELALSARLNFDGASDDAIQVLALELKSGLETFAMPAVLKLYLLHPTDASGDRVVKLMAAGGGRYRGQLPPLPVQRVYLRLIPAVVNKNATEDVSEQDSLHSAAWRLAGEIDFTSSPLVTLQASPALTPLNSD